MFNRTTSPYSTIQSIAHIYQRRSLGHVPKRSICQTLDWCGCVQQNTCTPWKQSMYVTQLIGPLYWQRLFQSGHPARNYSSSGDEGHGDKVYKNSVNKLLHIHGSEADASLVKSVQEIFLSDLSVVEDFVSETEEASLMVEVEKCFRRRKYEYGHWDGVIEGYRETEKSQWQAHNLPVINRIRNCSFGGSSKTIPAIHVLDLAKNGYIKAHVDSVRFCGSPVSGISLLSSAIMRFRSDKTKDSIMIDVKLPWRSLYIMSDRVRYDYTHEVLSETDSMWRDEHVARDRRVSIIVRNPP